MYIENIAPKLHGQSIILLDNAPCHPDIEVKAREIGLSIRKLPAYSPFLNAIEECFATMKTDIKATLEARRADLFDTNSARQLGITIARHRMNILTDAANHSLQVITVEKCIGWDNHCYSFVPDCLAKNDL